MLQELTKACAFDGWCFLFEPKGAINRNILILNALVCMTKKSFSPFDLAGSLSLAGLHTGLTLWHRLPMMAVNLADASLHRPEMNRMVSEKIVAMMQGAFEAQMELIRLTSRVMTGSLGSKQIMEMPAAIAGAALRPAFRKVKANSRRLGRRS
jgi:hypothetical protein